MSPIITSCIVVSNQVIIVHLFVKVSYVTLVVVISIYKTMSLCGYFELVNNP